MNWDAAGAIGEILGAVAVLITLVYVSAQIRQGTKATRLQTTHLTFHLSFEMVSLFSQGNNAEIWGKFRTEGWKPLTQGEQVVAGSIAIALFTTYDSHFHNFLEGTLSSEIHSSYRRRLSRQLMVPATREWWGHNKAQFTESFEVFVDEIVVEIESSAH